MTESILRQSREAESALADALVSISSPLILWLSVLLTPLDLLDLSFFALTRFSRAELTMTLVEVQVVGPAMAARTGSGGIIPVVVEEASITESTIT